MNPSNEPASQVAGVTTDHNVLARAIIPLAVCAILIFIPVPEGLTPNAWRYFALFCAVMTGIVTEPMPPAVLGLIGIGLAAALKLINPDASASRDWALSGFSNGTVWLIFSAYMFALGYTKTGLGRRIALLLIRFMGHHTLGLGYAIAFSDLALAPFMPSNTARSGGTIYPAIRNIPDLYDSYPNDPSARRIGAYLMYTALATTCVTSSLFLTALAPNVLSLGIVSNTLGLEISWLTWFQGMAPVGILMFALVPWLLYKIYPPQVTESPEAPRWAADELTKLGPMKPAEKTLLVLVSIALTLWITGGDYINATMTSIVVVGLMVVLRVVTWQEILSNTAAWNVLIWFGTLVTLAKGLADTGFIEWVARTLQPHLSGHSVFLSSLLITAAYYSIHYLFASTTAHVSALFPVFLAVALTLPGFSPTGWALVLSYTVGFMGILTPYATGPSPIYYGSGYVENKDFWRLGLILGGIFFAAFILIGIPWIRFLEI
jgi:L-tartrate/succinate antiporter